MSEDAAQRAAREKAQGHMATLAAASRAFYLMLKTDAHVDLRELVDPEGEAIGSLVDGEASAGAASLLLPMDLITTETWLLGKIGDRDELDLDVNTHKEMWFGLGAWIGEALRERHGGFWLFSGDDPKSWRMGFNKILLEIAPHAFAEKLLRSGDGFVKRMLSEIERIRLQHKAARDAEGGKLKARYGPEHYARLHSVPLGQWMVFDMARLQALWGQRPVKELGAAVGEAGKRLPPQNAPVLAKMHEALGKLDQDKPAAEQVKDRGLFEAIAQILALRRATQPVAVDMLEKIVFPTLHIGVPAEFPPLGDDDLANVRKGADLYAIYVDVVPWKHPGEDGGFMNTFAPADMATPYPDRQNLELGKGDWVMVNPARVRPMLEAFDGKRHVDAYERFVEYVKTHEGVPRREDWGKTVAEGVARSLGELKTCVLGLTQGHALVFRLLPPPG